MTPEKKGTNLLINKEDSSDDGLASDVEESTSVNSDEHKLDKNDTALDDDKGSDDESYEEYDMFSDGDYEGFAFVQDINCNMNDKARIPNSWILLDSQSTVDVFMNKKLLKNIQDAKRLLHCNASVAIVNKVSDLPGYGTVWFYKDGIAKILLLNNVKKKYRVTYDSTAHDCFEVHKADSTKCVFKPSKKGLFYLSVSKGITFVTTIEDKTSKFIVREYSNA